MVSRKLPIEVLQQGVYPAWFDIDSTQIQELLEKLSYKKFSDRQKRSGRLLSALLENPGRVIPVENLIERVWGDFDIPESALSTEASRLRKELIGTPLAYRILNKSISFEYDPVGEHRGYYIFVPSSIFSVIAYLSPGLEYLLLEELLENPKPTYIPLKEIFKLLPDTNYSGYGGIRDRKNTLINRTRKALSKAENILKKPLGELVSVREESGKIIGYLFNPGEIELTQQPIESQYSHLVVSAPSLSDAIPSHQP